MKNLVKELEPIDKYLLLLLSSSSENQKIKSIKGNLRLQKEMFLVSKAVKEFEEAFEPYRLGPFSEMVEESVDQLTVSKFLERIDDEIRLTDKGAQLAKSVHNIVQKTDKEIVSGIRNFTEGLSYDELLVLVYGNFEETTENSQIKEYVEKKRLSVAITLFRKGKIGTDLAARISGLSVKEFVDEIRRLGIKTPVKPDPEIEKLRPIILSALSKRVKIISKNDITREIRNLSNGREILWIKNDNDNFEWTDLNENGLDNCLKLLNKKVPKLVHVGTNNKETTTNEYFTFYVRD